MAKLSSSRIYGSLVVDSLLDVGRNIRAQRYTGINSLVLNSYATVNPASNVFLYSQANDRDSWLYLDSADTASNWGIYHRQIDSAVSGLPGNSIGFVGGGNSSLKSYIDLLNGNGYFAGNVGIGTTSPNAKLDVSGGVDVRGNIRLTGDVTATNQSRTIEFTGFDKEATNDFSDAAFIRHTVNTGGHAGSVLEISSQNDSNDGIALTTNASSQVRHNGHIMWDANNDGSGSGLDADTTDGLHMVSLTQAQYDALGSKDANTIYFITA